MIAWLLKSIGVNDEIAAHVTEAQWAWTRPAWLWIGMVLLIPISWWIILRHRQGLPHIAPRHRAILSVCRIGVLALLVVVLGGPYLKLEESAELKPIVAVLVDRSLSMSLPVGPYAESDRQRLAPFVGDGAQSGSAIDALERRELFSRAWDRLKGSAGKGLENRFDIREYSIAADIQPGVHTELDMSETALGPGIERAVHDAAGREIAGIVLASDGQWTAGASPVTIARRIARSAAKPPIFTLPVGSTTPPPDVAVVDIIAPLEVAKDDTPAIVATVTSTGFDARNVEVTLREDERVLDTQRLTLATGQRQPVRLSFTASEAGTRILTVAVAPQDSETVLDNNEQQLPLHVGTDKIKVLYIEGHPRWDFRFLDHALRRDHGLDVRIVMESQLEAAGASPDQLATAAQLPTDAKGFEEFHLVMVGDVSPNLLTTETQAALLRAVQKSGVGVLIQGGMRHMPLAYVHGPLSDILPIRPNPHHEAPAFAPHNMSVTPTGSIHPAFSLFADPSRNRETWSSMQSFFWMAGSAGLASGATTLAEVQTPGGTRPLIIEHFAGRGRVLFIGTDETFRWRRNVGDAVFYRFWGQAIRHVARKRGRDGNESWIETMPAQTRPGSTIRLELFAVDADRQPLNRETVSVTVKDGENSTAIVMRKSERPGFYRGEWVAQRPGVATLTYTDAAGQVTSATARIAESGRELRDPAVDRETLAAVADASGGRMLELDELDRLPALLGGETRVVTRVHESEVWDNWLMLLLLVGLYCTDVGVRRVLGLT